MDIAQIQEFLSTVGLQMAINVGMAALILIVGFMVAGSVARFIRRIPDRNPKLDKTLANFFASMAKWAILAVVIIAVLTRFGVETTSLVAALGAVTLAIGFALQGTLSNVAAGVMIVFFRPYKIGDFVEVAGVAGSVKDVTLFYTELNTPDNKQIIIPNRQSWGDVITNYSAYPTRRCDFVFSASYDDDIEKVIGVLRETFDADERVLKDPELFVEVKAHGASSVDYVVRAWCNAGDYWGLHFDMNKAVKVAFDKNEIEIPYPHQVEIQKKG
ncbi:mechanosensitive ion channel [Maricaulaceae bacterium NA33B04]|nr:mechanosensitive ion channel [Maricaulaceae bacterium NA33B04]